jgi:AcrR family transcriptional regulator
MFKTTPTTALTKKAEATSARILDVALDLFRRQGFEQTTMRGIAAEAGVSLGSAYYYFESKEDLVMAFYERAIAMNGPSKRWFPEWRRPWPVKLVSRSASLPLWR